MERVITYGVRWQQREACISEYSMNITDEEAEAFRRMSVTERIDWINEQQYNRPADNMPYQRNEWGDGQLEDPEQIELVEWGQQTRNAAQLLRDQVLVGREKMGGNS